MYSHFLSIRHGLVLQAQCKEGLCRALTAMLSCPLVPLRVLPDHPVSQDFIRVQMCITSERKVAADMLALLSWAISQECSTHGHG